MLRLGCFVVTVVLSLAPAVSAGQVPLVTAVKAGNRDAVRTLIRQRVDVNASEADGMTALHWAVLASDQPAVQMLLAAGANANAVNRYGVSVLSVAATNGNAALIEALVKAGADPNASTPDGQTVLMDAARTGNVESVRSLVAHGANVNARESWQGQTALMLAASHNNGAVVKLLAEAGAEVNARSKELTFPAFTFMTDGMVVTMLPRGSFTALMFAARNGAIDAVRALAEAKADLDVKDPDGTTALMFAIVNAHFDTALELINKGANPNVVDITGMSPLYAAVDMSTIAPMISRPAPRLLDDALAIDVIRALLAHGANPNVRLTRPIIGRHHNVVGDAQLADGTTPLLRATKGNDLPVMKLLLDAGADPTLTLKDRTTPIMLAAAGGATVGGFASAIRVTEDSSIEAIKLCLDKGVDLNAFTTRGDTALHLAAARGADKTVAFLVEHGAKLDLRDRSGRTPLDVAAGAGADSEPTNDGFVSRRRARPTTVAILRDFMMKAGLPIAAPAAAPVRPTP